MKILAVCGMGIGSSMLLRMNAEKALKRLGLTDVDFDIADIGSARGQAATADIVITSKELAEQLGPVKAKVVTITNYVSIDEMVTKLRAVLEAK